ncbi:MAG: nitrite reductase large subunit NirB [Pseudomonadota bacterium]|nr:nitrite reductase large subunit NirB [Pseudomonadota bacterium]
MHIVVIGNGMVGQRFVEEIAAHKNEHQLEVTVLAEECRPAYDRVHLSSFFSGSTADDLALTTEAFFEENDITLKLSAPAKKLNPEEKTVETTTGEVISYDKLVLATGSYPFVPPIPGNDQPHCLVYRTIEDLEAMQTSAKESKIGVVVGGGLLGLEAAKALKDLGLETHVVEFAPRLMAVQVDDGAGGVLRAKIESMGVGVHTEKNTQEIVAGETSRYRMNFADGSHLETDMILFSAGIRPRDELAGGAGIELGPRGGIMIDNECKTSDNDIYAIGECALYNGMIYGLVAPGYQMAEVVAQSIIDIAEDRSRFEGADMSTKLKLMGVDVASIGDAHGRTEGARSYTFIDEPNEVYKKMVVSADGKTLLGAVLVGDAEAYNDLLQIMLNQIELPENAQSFILPNVEGGAPMLGADALPDSAIICSCNSVSKGDIVQAVEAGSVCDVATLKSCTKAGTTCGGCAPLAKSIMDTTLESLGIEVDNSLCEHFSYTRQELYHLVRVGEIKDFNALLEKHGQGKGCEICKPTAASIFASCWNDYVLEDKLAGLQETNDYFLGNVQKNGTYSIVPRVAGGEILPEQLIALGEIGKEYNLYTKITGGQRIDLFGARVDQLPEIWEKLIAVGFETGQAYGKSLRTVKSCVGSTWCRYGVDDSVGFAIELENRYKGLRSPHKLKMAVSGCTRECAEAQSKDVGVIATEGGWNLYVCGNGGMRPRHADLLASDLDKETLIKYVDRFYMFYIQTADKLQRTSVWMENLEGGLDYLREVIVEDSLGLGATLEAQMQEVVDTFQCEWKTTVENEERRKRFRQFTNSQSVDESLAYQVVRGQRIPLMEEKV